MSAPTIHSKSDAYALIEWGRKYPVDWVRAFIGEEPTDYQAWILESVRDHRKTAMGSCHAAGKSGCLGKMVSPWWVCNHPQSILITTAPTYRQVRGILWDRIRSAHHQAARNNLPLGGSLNVTRWSMDTGWFAEGVTAPPTDPDKFQGFHAESGRLLCVVDEAAGLSQTLYDGGVKPITIGEDDRLVLIGNTTSTTGEFFDASKGKASYNYRRVSAFDTPNFTETGITRADILSGEWEEKLAFWRKNNPGQSLPRSYLVSPAWVADMAESWGPRSILFRTRIDAEFLNEGENILVEPSWIEAAQSRDLSNEGRGFDGLDVAGRGKDWSVYGRLSLAGHYRRLWKQAESTTTLLVSLVKQTCARDALPQCIAVDATGIGEGVEDVLREAPPTRGAHVGLGTSSTIHRFIAGSKARDPDRFPNRRSELAWGIRRAFETGQMDLDPADHELAEELSSIQWKANKGKYIFSLEPKEDYIKRTDKSPDHFDALLCAFAAREVQTRGLIALF